MAKIGIGQTVDITVGNFKNIRGEAAQIDTGQPVSWDVENPESFEITPGEVTPTSATASFKHIGTEEIPAAAVTFTADGDTDSDEQSVVTVNGVIAVDSLNAVSGEMTFGDPHE